MIEQVINIDRMEQAVALFGTFDENIRLIQNEYMVSVICRGSELKITGEAENVSRAAKVIDSVANSFTVNRFAVGLRHGADILTRFQSAFNFQR